MPCRSPAVRLAACAPRLISLLLLAALAAPLQAAPREPAEARVIVKLDAAAHPADDERLDRGLAALGRRHAAGLTVRRSLGERTRLVTASGTSSAALAKRLAAEPGVAYAVPDQRVRRLAAPNDPLYATGGAAGPAVGQWYLKPPSTTVFAAIDAERAWDLTANGSASVVVAVLDSGVRLDHPDLAGKLLPGYDFVSPAGRANDGNGRDADPSDPGDWVTQADINSGVVESDCEVEDSSWHGTQVAGLVGANTHNAAGMAGAGRNVSVLPVRVLGKCGGFVSDIVEAMRWAAGIPVAGVPNNLNHAKVINLSLGVGGVCSAAFADAVAAVAARGTVVVAAAGNTAGHAVVAPANCAGVIGVAGVRHIGTKVGFSDLGPELAIAAPAGNCVDLAGPCQYPILTTSNSGATSPASSIYTDEMNITVGTSFASPLVSGTVGLLLSARPGLTPVEIKRLLQGTAYPFPTSGADAGVPQCTAPQTASGGTAIDQLECYCTTSTCGAGLLDARAAALAATTLLATIGVSPAAAQAGQPLTLDVNGSLLQPGRSIASATWTLVDGGGIVGGFNGSTNTSATGATTVVTPTAAGSFTVDVTVVDNTGVSASTTGVVSVADAASPPPASGGGGGAMGGGYLLLLLAAVAAAARLTRRRA